MGFVEYVEIVCGLAVLAYVVFFVMSMGLFNKDE